MTNRLEKLHKSAFPLAVRGTLNRAAFDVKQRSLLEVTKQTFTTREKNFFKANSRVKKADGFNTKTMYSEVGMQEGGLRGGNNFAVRDLVQQERGGQIGGRSFIPISSGARVGGSVNRKVKPKARISGIQSVLDAKNASGNSNAERYIKSAIEAGPGGYVLSTFKSGDGNRILMRIDSIKRVGRNTRVKSTPLYAFKKDRSVKVKGTHFMERSARDTARNLARYYNEEGMRQFKRLR